MRIVNLDKSNDQLFGAFTLLRDQVMPAFEELFSNFLPQLETGTIYSIHKYEYMYP